MRGRGRGDIYRNCGETGGELTSISDEDWFGGTSREHCGERIGRWWRERKGR